LDPCICSAGESGGAWAASAAQTAARLLLGLFLAPLRAGTGTAPAAPGDEKLPDRNLK